MTTPLAQFLGEVDDPPTRFDLGAHQLGAFGGVFGGTVAACALRAARGVVPGRRPTSLDARFVRALPPGEATATVEVVHAGRVLTTVFVKLAQTPDRIAAVATIGLVDEAALHELAHEAQVDSPDDDVGSPWPSDAGVPIAIVDTLQPRLRRRDDGATATTITLPWASAHTSAEAACVAADLSVGPPVAEVCYQQRIPHPNPDLSLRFTAEPAAERVSGVARLAHVKGGTATVALEVRSSGRLLAAGISTSLLLAGG
jgi:acyl-coenzyme A thioesterase PaaI-like protein